MRQLLLLAALSLSFFTGALAQTPQTSTSNKTIVEVAADSPDHSTLVGVVQATGLTETLKGKGPFTVFAPTNKAFEKFTADLGKENKKSMKKDKMERDNTKMKRDTMSKTQDTSTTWTQPPTRTDTIPNNMGTSSDTISNTLLQPENRAELTTVLNYHVVQGNYNSTALKQAIEAGNGKAELTTINGAKLTATMQGNTIQLEDVAGNRALVTTADLMGSNGVIHVIDKVIMPTDNRDKK